MVYKQRHMELGGTKVISHFTFSPPLIAASELEGHGCFIFPINSTGEVYRQDGKTSVQSGEGVLMKCGSYVNRWENLEKGGASEVVILRLFPELLKANLDREMLAGLEKRICNRRTTARVKIDTMMSKFLESLFFYFDNPSLISDELVNLKLKELLLLLVNLQDSDEVLELLQALFDKDTYSLKEILDAHVFENLTLNELASIACMSPSSFKRKCKESFGKSPGAYIRDKRMEAAEEMLRHTKKSISSIAYDIGFSDPDYFSKSFRSYTGKSPREFRSSYLL